MGIDIPVSRFEAFAPKSHLGPLGYPFAINTNGFLIFHPNLWMIANYLEDPAHNVSQLIWVFRGWKQDGSIFIKLGLHLLKSSYNH